VLATVKIKCNNESGFARPESRGRLSPCVLRLAAALPSVWL